MEKKIRKKKFKLSKSSKKNLDIRSELIKLVLRVLAKSEYDFGIPETGGFRTAQEQNNLFHKRTSSGKRVTQLDGFNKLSYHQSGEAFDVFMVDDKGRACWRCTEKYDYVANLVKEEFKLMQEEGSFLNERIIWGGDWKRFVDRPHFEVRST